MRAALTMRTAYPTARLSVIHSPAPCYRVDMDGTTEPSPHQMLTIPAGREITGAQIHRENGSKWDVCEWYNHESRGFLRRLDVTEGQDLQPWIVERFGSGKYRLMLMRGSRNGGFSSPFEIADPAHPKRSSRHGGPEVALPLAGNSLAPGWAAQQPAAPSSAAPSWQQMQEWQERTAERERLASAERLAAIRADEDERRRRREDEERDRRRRDQEDDERRLAVERDRVKAEREAMEARHRMELEKIRTEHEFRMKQAELDRERERERSERERTPTAEDFADALESAKEEILATVAKKEPEASPWGQLVAMVAPHMPTIVGAMQGLAKAAQQSAARPPAWAPPAMPPGEPHP